VCEPRNDGSVLRSYYFRYTWKAGRPWLSMGHIDELTLSAAREKAAEFRQMVREGKDPRRAAAVTADGQQTFLAYWTEIKSDLIGKEGEYPWAFAVRNFSKLHDRPVATITNLYAQGLKQPRKLSPVKPHAALPYDKLPAFVAGLAHEATITARCAEFAILTGARSQEARLAQWSWLNADMTEIMFPAEVMKAKLKHVVPLAKQVTDMLRKLPRTSEYIFPSPRTFDKDDELLAPQTLVDLVNRVWGRDKLHLHGFRSTFRDFGADKLDVAKEVLEFCLAHRMGSAAEKAYWRSDMIEKRRVVMQAYADYAKPTGKVVRLRAA
jgi:integrase